MRACLAVFRSNLRWTPRDRWALFFSYAAPLIFFFVFAGLSGGTGNGIPFFVAMVLVIGILAMGYGTSGCGRPP